MKEKIRELQDQLTAIEQAKRYLLEIDKKLIIEQDKTDRLQILVEKEYEDVRRLKEQSLGKMLVGLLRDKTAELEKEKQEYLEAVLLLREAEKSEKLLHFEKQVLTEKVSKEGALRTELTQVRQAYIEKAIPSKSHVPLIETLNEIARSERLEKELQEVLDLGESCQLKLTSMQNSMHQMASNISLERTFRPTRDLFAQVEKLEKTLLSLRSEFLKYEADLREISHYTEISPTVSHNNHWRQKMIYNVAERISKFTENFVRNIVNDFSVQQKMTTAQSFLHEIHYAIGQIQKEVQREKEAVQEDRKAAQKKEADFF